MSVCPSVAVLQRLGVPCRRSIRPNWKEERRVNTETFGQPSVRRGGYYRGGRGGGGYRGGGNYNSGGSNYYRGQRGGYNHNYHHGQHHHSSDQQQQQPRQSGGYYNNRGGSGHYNQRGRGGYNRGEYTGMMYHIVADLQGSCTTCGSEIYDRCISLSLAQIHVAFGAFGENCIDWRICA